MSDARRCPGCGWWVQTAGTRCGICGTLLERRARQAGAVVHWLRPNANGGAACGAGDLVELDVDPAFVTCSRCLEIAKAERELGERARMTAERLRREGAN